MNTDWAFAKPFIDFNLDGEGENQSSKQHTALQKRLATYLAKERTNEPIANCLKFFSFWLDR